MMWGHGTTARRLVPALVLAAILQGCGGDAAGDAAVFRGGPERTGVFDDRGPTELEEVVWKASDGGFFGSPVVAGGAVYVPTDDGLTSYDARSGELRWVFESDDDVGSTPEVVDGTVLFGDEDGWLYAVDAETGRERWRFRTDGPIYAASTLVVDDLVVIGTESGSLHAVDLRTGQEEWMVDGDDFFTPALAGRRLIVPGDDGLYAFDPRTGDELWRYSGGSFFAAPAIAGDTAIVGDGEGTVHAVDLRDGVGVWRSPASDDEIYSSAAVVDGLALVGTREGLVALDLDSGETAWRFRTEGYVYSSPAVAGRTAYFGTEGGVLHAVETRSGDELWQYDAFSPIFSSPAIWNGTVLFTTFDGMVALG